MRDRCEATAKYRRARAEGIAGENARWAANRAAEAEHAAWVANHPVRGHIGDYIFWTVFTIGVLTLVVAGLIAHISHS